MKNISMRLLIAAGGLPVVAACSGNPSGPDSLDVSPESAGVQAVAKYDSNGDGELNEDELENCTSLREALGRCDADGNGQLSAQEIAERVRYHQNTSTTIIGGSVEITLDGKPLEGATISFEPESFLGDAYQPVSAVTDSHGRASLQGQHPKFPGLYLGFYRVRVSKLESDRETVPEKYNRRTLLGYEAAEDIEEIQNVIQFNLMSD